MTKRLLPSLLIVLVLLGVACGGSSAAEQDAAANTNTNQETTTLDPTTTTSEASGAPESTESTEAPSTTETVEEPPAGELDGATIYEANCARCHGADGTGGRGSSLVDHVADQGDKAADIDVINNGGINMPSFQGKLSDEEIMTVVDHVYDAFGASS